MTPNTTSTLVVSSAAVVMAAYPVQIERAPDPVLLGVGVAGWAPAFAGASVDSAVQVVA